jgi:HK97 family phage major capsid protein
MIPKSDKKRIWAVECCRGYSPTAAHSPSLLAGLGLALVAMLLMTVFVCAESIVGPEAGAVLAIAPNVALVEARNKLEAKQKALEKVFEEAKTPAGELDFRKVKCLGDNMTTVQIAEKVRDMNKELIDLHDECMKLVDAEGGLKTIERLKGLRHPEPDLGAPLQDPGQKRQIKSIGEIITSHERYEKKEWQSGFQFSIPEVYPSELLAKSAQFKTLMETTAGWAPESIRVPGLVVEKATRPVQLIDIIPIGQTGMEKVVYMEETTRTHSAAEKAEGAAFAESAFVLTERESNVRKITDSLPVTDEQLEDVPMVSSYVNGRLVFGLRQRLDTQTLIGDGSAPNLRGIKNISGIQTQAKGSDPIPDAFFKAMTKLRVTGRVMPTHHIIHPTNWETVRLMRTADGLYIWGNPSEAGPERMWGLPVVQVDIDSAGTGYTISALPQWMSLFERRGVDVQVGYIGDQFVQGKRTIRADMRFAFVVFRAAAICSVTSL